MIWRSRGKGSGFGVQTPRRFGGGWSPPPHHRAWRTDARINRSTGSVQADQRINQSTVRRGSGQASQRMNESVDYEHESPWDPLRDTSTSARRGAIGLLVTGRQWGDIMLLAVGITLTPILSLRGRGGRRSLTSGADRYRPDREGSSWRAEVARWPRKTTCTLLDANDSDIAGRIGFAPVRLAA